MRTSAASRSLSRARRSGTPSAWGRLRRRMSFVHDDPEFVALLTQVSAETGIAAALVEKDYWITHSLWALHETELAIWFQGGTSLSKGFGIIERFSEDLDLMIERGSLCRQPSNSRTRKGPIRAFSST